jgi:uncharacterized membrane protein HdeD (DUF308 family)
MNNDVVPDKGSPTRQRSAPSPTVAWLPGAALLLIGLWMVTDGGISLGWAVGALGLALVLVGAVAQGVAWEMDIHKERHP